MFGTTVIATPDVLEALALGSHIAVMLNGRILQQGEIKEVYYKPKNIDVARIFNHPPMNFFNAKLVKDDGTYYIKSNDELKIEATSIKHLLGEKDEFVLGIRGGDLASEEEENMLSITATVELIELRGSDSIVYYDYRGSLIRQLAPKGVMHEIGEKIKLYVHPEKIYVFDGKTKNLIARYQS
jgi:ABC-type sugar transport system ATPase subunit